MSVRPRASGDPDPPAAKDGSPLAGMNGGERHAGSLHRHLGEEIFHFEPQVRDGVIDRFGGVAHYFRGGRVCVAAPATSPRTETT
jgi:hypothetical protein